MGGHQLDPRMQREIDQRVEARMAKQQQIEELTAKQEAQGYLAGALRIGQLVRSSMASTLLRHRKVWGPQRVSQPYVRPELVAYRRHRVTKRRMARASRRANR